MATLDKRVQVLLPEKEWQELTYIASEQNQSVGHLIREAVTQVYFTKSSDLSVEDKLRMLDELAELNLPVADWEQMEDESIDQGFVDA